MNAIAVIIFWKNGSYSFVGSFSVTKTFINTLVALCDSKFLTWVISAEDIRRRCSASFSCGDQKDLMYPFWIPGREDCGHPDFKLECNASFAELTISSVKFRILEMNYSSRVIRLSRSDYISYICPLNPVSAPFEENVIPFAPDTEMLTIYYDCRTELTQSVSTYVGEISCHDDVRSYYVTRNLSSPLLNGVEAL